MEFIHQPATSNRLGEFLVDNLKSGKGTFRAAIAFVKRSGTKHVSQALAKFSQANRTELIVGINHRGTSKEGLEDLLKSMGKQGRVIIFNNPKGFTFHPKTYLFKTDERADLLIGSGNLTEGGMFTNYEAGIRLRLDLSKKDDAACLKSAEETLDRWADLTTGTARVLTNDFLTKLVARGLVPLEALSVPDSEDKPSTRSASAKANEENLFDGASIPRAPSVRRPATVARTAGVSATRATTTRTVTSAGNRGFVMVLQKTDVGVGQTTKGTSRRSPEIFIPLKARDADPDFWGWPGQFIDSPKKYDRSGVRMRLGTDIISVNMMGWKIKHDLRLRHERLRSAGRIGDILRMEKAPKGRGFEYDVEVVLQGSPMYSVYLARCTETIPRSPKTFGYY